MGGRRDGVYLLANDLAHMLHENGFSFVSNGQAISTAYANGERSLLGEENPGHSTGAEMALEML